jgi:antitoxin MazE
MITKIIKIGNSKGIRIPKYIFDKSTLKVEEFEIEVKDDKIILRPATKVRDNWDKAFQRMSKNEDDVLLNKEYLKNSSSGGNEEWEW